MFSETVWKNGENLVAEYMTTKGYKIIYKNYFCKIAELDIVAVFSKKLQKKLLKQELKTKIKMLTDKTKLKLLKISHKESIKQLVDLLVVTEVKSRSNAKFGFGFDSVLKSKVQHMKNGAEILLKEKRFKNFQIRFDVASVDNGKITYIENAF